MKKFTTHKLSYYPEKIMRVLAGEIVTPLQCEVSLTSACNFRCPWCVFDYTKHESNFLDFDSLIHFIDDLALMKVRSVVYAGTGEPFLYKRINEIISYTASKGIKIGITTNGSLIKEHHFETIVKYCSWIRFSITSFSEEFNKRIYGTNNVHTKDIFETIKALCGYKFPQNKDFEIGVQSVLCHPNINEYLAIIGECDFSGVDYYMLRPFFLNPKNHYTSLSEYLLDKNIKLSIYAAIRAYPVKNVVVLLREETERLMYNRSYNLCRALPFIFALEADGNVFNCFPERTGESEFCIGNIYKKRLPKIWGGEKHKNFLLNVLPKVDKSKCQPYCRHHPGNEYLEELSNPTEKIEFP